MKLNHVSDGGKEAHMSCDGGNVRLCEGRGVAECALFVDVGDAETSGEIFLQDFRRHLLAISPDGVIVDQERRITCSPSLSHTYTHIRAR